MESISAIYTGCLTPGKGYTALHFATVNNNCDILRCALSYSAFLNPSVIDARSSTKTSMNPDEILDASLEMRQTALHKAAIYGHTRAAEILLLHGKPSTRETKPR